MTTSPWKTHFLPNSHWLPQAPQLEVWILNHLHPVFLDSVWLDLVLVCACSQSQILLVPTFNCLLCIESTVSLCMSSVIHYTWLIFLSRRLQGFLFLFLIHYMKCPLKSFICWKFGPQLVALMRGYTMMLLGGRALGEVGHQRLRACPGKLYLVSSTFSLFSVCCEVSCFSNGANW